MGWGFKAQVSCPLESHGKGWFNWQLQEKQISHEKEIIMQLGILHNSGVQWEVGGENVIFICS